MRAKSPRRIRAGACALVAVVALLAAVEAHAIYKCAGPHGSPIYQEDACPAGKELRNFDTDPPNLSVVPYGSGMPSSRSSQSSTSTRATKESKAPKSDRQAKPRGDPAERKHVRIGMSEAELIAHLGRPDITSGNKQKRTLHWTWLPVEGDPDTITTVTLANGAVSDVDRKVVKK